VGCTQAPLYSLNACMGQDEDIFLAKSRPSPYLSEALCIYVLGPVPGVDAMAKRPQGLLNVGALSARMAVLHSCALGI
jgi:hypothetical protein